MKTNIGSKRTYSSKLYSVEIYDFSEMLLCNSLYNVQCNAIEKSSTKMLWCLMLEKKNKKKCCSASKSFRSIDRLRHCPFSCCTMGVCLYDFYGWDIFFLFCYYFETLLLVVIEYTSTHSFTRCIVSNSFHSYVVPYKLMKVKYCKNMEGAQGVWMEVNAILQI